MEVAPGMTCQFVHLHTHSYFSLLAGLAAPEALVQRVARLGQPALALTDHNNMFGAIRFYRAARAAGVKPIFGLQLAVGSGGHPLTLLAQTNGGYRNLLRLATAVRTERPSRRARPASGLGSAAHLTAGRAATGSAYSHDGTVSRQLLLKHRDGLFVLSGGARGELASFVRAGRTAEATQLGAHLRDAFGRDNFYIELQNQALPEQASLNAALAALARELNVGVVATNDVRYLHSEDAGAHAALLAMGARTTLANPDRPTLGSAEFYLTSAEQMRERFADMPEALANTALIAQRCHVELDVGRLRLPAFRGKEAAPSVSAESEGTSGEADDGIEVDTSDSEQFVAARLLAERAWGGARERFGTTLPANVEKRLRHELDIIGGRGLAAYFLLVEDIVDEAKRRGIPVGPGRGSAASSLVAYCLGITAVDPLRYGLVFERFLNPERVRMPDIDIDVCDTRRDELLEYVRERFGQENVAQIVTFGTLAARAALREAGKVLEVSRAKIDRVAGMIPVEPGVTLQRAEQAVPALARAVRADAELQRLYSLARAVEGVPRHLSIHAAGIVIGDEALGEDFPLIVPSERLRMTQYAMDDVEALGFLKMDLLGLRTLTVLDHARAYAAAQATSRPTQHGRPSADRGALPPQHGVSSTPRGDGSRTLSFDDEAVYEGLRVNGTAGIFQLETPMFRNLVERLQPTTFADIVALLALGRPGPMQRVEQFIRRRHGREPVRYIHKALEPILKETYGIIVYQEQVMHIAMKLANYSPAEADLLRRRLTDEGGTLPQAERERFLRGAESNGIGRDASQRVLDELMQFAGYGFAKSHSVAYAMLTYETAWLRTHFPAAFFAALLTSHMGNPERIRRYVGAAKSMGTTVLGPDVNRSGVDFEPVASATGGEEAVSFGLAGIRHVGRGAAEAVVEARGNKPFSSFDDFCQRLPSAPNRSQLIRVFVEAGACDGFGISREDMLAAVGSPGREAASGQTSLFAAGGREKSLRKDEVSDMINVKHSGFVLQLAAGHERYWPELHALLAAHKGEVPVTIKLPTAEGTVTIAVDRGLWVDGGSQLLQRLQHWIKLGRLTGVTRVS